MMENGRGLIKALENWAKKVTTGYNNVNVRDLSTSFRDGLAFCAIIHHYRPDLIDFDSLTKENIFDNNSLAFSVAEKQLGVPALLDAEDMVQYSNPDRLSIITYLSQLRNCFENQNKVNIKKTEKRVQNNISGPPMKIPAVQPSILPAKRHEVCQVCKHRVFILERLIVDRKLYHTTCFRCHKCNSLLNPGAYVESDTAGLYECSVCLVDEAPENVESFSQAPELKEQETDMQTVPSPKPLPSPQKDFTSKEALKFVKSNLSPESPNTRPKSPTFQNTFAIKNFAVSKNSGTSVKDKINAFEKNQVKENSSPNVSPSSFISASKLQQSVVSDDSTPSVLTNRLSSQSSFISAKSSDGDREQDSSFSSVHKLAKEPISSGKYSYVDERNTNVSIVKSNEKSCDNTNFISADKVPKSNLEISPNQTTDLNTDSRSILSVKSGDESPKVSRDIFKTSLQPLKLSLPSSIRKEQTEFSGTSSESEKVLDIPQIKSNYSVTLPRTSITRHLSPKKDALEIKSSNSDSNVNCDDRSQNLSKLIRRSSLESSSESSGNKQSTDLTSSNPSSRLFNRTISAQEINFRDGNDSLKSPLKTYTPIYKSILNSSSLTSNSVLKSNFDILSKQSLESKSISDVKSGNAISSISSIHREHTESIHEMPDKTSGHDKIPSEETKDDLKILSNSSKNSSLEISIQESKEEEYPDDLNPFGDDEEDNDKKEEEYPDDLNPFGDEEEEAENTTKISIDDYDESKNPFASDEEESDIQLPNTPIYSPKPSILENRSPNFHDSISSNLSSPSGSLKGTLKKRQAPKPPTVNEIFHKDSSDSTLDSSFSIIKTSPSVTKKTFQAPSPKIRKNKPAPPPPTPPIQDAANVKMSKETDNLKLKSSMQSTEEKSLPKQFKKKKRPAPPVPIPMRQNMKKIPLKEIMQEMKEIEEKQREYEKQGREIELLIRDRDKDEEPSVEEEEYIIQLFELVNQKNALFRRQAELMYIKRSQRLEEQQYQIEKEIRLLMEKPESDKTDEDRQKEEELTMELIDIVDQRNSIIDSIEMDRRRELEEDHSVQEQMEIKNGDLPITAEIKQKSKNKNKKSKERKEQEAKKKKKQEEQQSGKGTLKKKKLFSKKP